MKKIIYSDLDGTLFDYNENGSFVSDENIVAVNEWTKNNYFGVATGRNVLSVSKLFENTKLNINVPFVLTNGTCIYNLKEDKIIYKKAINKLVIDEAIDYIKEKPIAILLLIAPKARYYVGNFDESKFKRPNFEFTEIEKENIDYDDIVKIDFMVNPNDNEELTKDIKKFKNINLISLVPSSLRYVELINSEASKYKGIQKALEYFKMDNYKLFTIGDYLNDYEMILNANVAFAPSNAHEKIKDIAHHIVKSNKEHAIFEMIQIINKL